MGPRGTSGRLQAQSTGGKASCQLVTKTANQPTVNQRYTTQRKRKESKRNDTKQRPKKPREMLNESRKPCLYTVNQTLSVKDQIIKEQGYVPIQSHSWATKFIIHIIFNNKIFFSYLTVKFVLSSQAIKIQVAVQT